jgi:hypothetical protein
MRSLSFTHQRPRAILLSQPIDNRLAPAGCLARCSVSCVMTKPASQGRHFRIARVAHKSCALVEGLKGSIVCLIYTYSSAELASCPIPKKARRLATPNSGRKSALGISTSSAIQPAKLNDATSKQRASHRWMQFKDNVRLPPASPSKGPC